MKRLTLVGRFFGAEGWFYSNIPLVQFLSKVLVTTIF
jgi:hypothetical protein